MHVRGLQEAQPAAAELEHFAVGEALNLAPVVPGGDVEVHRQRAARQRRVRRRLQDAVHPAALVALEVQQRHVLQPRRVQDLRDRRPHRLVGLVHAGVDQRRALVVDQELVEGDAVLGFPGGDAIDAIADRVDSGDHGVPFLCVIHTTQRHGGTEKNPEEFLSESSVSLCLCV